MTHPWDERHIYLFIDPIKINHSCTHTIHVWYIHLHLVDFYGKLLRSICQSQECYGVYIYKYTIFFPYIRVASCMGKFSFPIPQKISTTSATASPIHFKGFPAAQLAMAALNASLVAVTKPLPPVELLRVSFGST